MKSFWSIILAFILCASIGVGIFFGFKYKENIKEYFSNLASSSEESSSSIEDSPISSEDNSSSSSSSSSSEEVLDYKALYEEQLGLNNTLIDTNSNLEKELDKYNGITFSDSLYPILTLYEGDNVLLCTGVIEEDVESGGGYVYFKTNKISGFDLSSLKESLKNLDISKIVKERCEMYSYIYYNKNEIYSASKVVDNYNINSVTILIDNKGDAGYVNINDNPVIHAEWEDDAYTTSVVTNSFSFNEETGMYDLDVRIIFTWNCASI